MGDIFVLLIIAVIYIGIPLAIISCGIRALYFLIKKDYRKSARWLVITLVFGIPVIVLFTFMAMAVDKCSIAAKTNRCGNNLGQIGRAITIFYLDHSNYPASFQNLTNYLENPKPLICPSSGHQTGSLSNVTDWTDYYYVSGLNGSDPSECLLAYCNCPNHKSGVAVFLDTSVRYYTPKDLQALTNNFGITNQAVLREIKIRVKIIRGTGQIGK